MQFFCCERTSRSWEMRQKQQQIQADGECHVRTTILITQKKLRKNKKIKRNNTKKKNKKRSSGQSLLGP